MSKLVTINKSDLKSAVVRWTKLSRDDYSCTEWIRNRINIPRQLTEPFCWHDGRYCNVAYSDHCLKCREAINAYHQFSE